MARKKTMISPGDFIGSHQIEKIEWKVDPKFTNNLRPRIVFTLEDNPDAELYDGECYNIVADYFPSSGKYGYWEEVYDINFKYRATIWNGKSLSPSEKAICRKMLRRIYETKSYLNNQ